MVLLKHCPLPLKKKVLTSLFAGPMTCAQVIITPGVLLTITPLPQPEPHCTPTTELSTILAKPEK